MSDTPLPIEANLVELDGATQGTFYPVRLYAVPRAGDLIDLYSFIDTANNDEPSHWYEVVAILHQVYDVTKANKRQAAGHHHVTVFVKPSESPLLENGRTYAPDAS